jgi:hypothetical protein
MKRMPEIISIEIQADKSTAEDALKQVKQALDEGKQAADALSHALDGDLSGAFKSLGELGKTLGITLDLAFSPVEIIAFVKVIAEVTDKLSTLISDTFIYTDQQKALDSQIKSSNQVIAEYAGEIKKLDEAYAKMGKTASQGIAIDIAKLKPQLDAAIEAVRTLTGDVAEAKEKASNPNLINAIGNAKALPGLNNALGVAQQSEKMLSDQMRNLTEAFKEQQNAEFEAMAEAEIAGRLRVQEAAINAEKAKWDRIQGLTKTSVDENLAMETGFENRLYQVKREALRERLELKKLDPDHNAAETTAMSRELEAMAKDHEAALTRIKTEGDSERLKIEDQQRAALGKQNSDILAQAQKENNAIIKAADEQLQAWDVGYKGQIEAAKQASEIKIQLITQDFERGKITQQQEIAAIAKAKQDELAMEVLFHKKRQALWAGDLKKVQEIENQIAKAQQQSALVGTKAVTDGLKAQEQQYKQVFQQIGNAFASTITGLVEGTETVSQAFTKMFDSMIQSLVNYLVQKEAKKAEEWALDAIHAAAKKALNVAGAHSSANAAAANTLADVPYPLNIPASTSVLAVGEAYADSASAEGGQYLVPGPQLTMLHPQEMVLPAGLANQMRNVISGGGNGGGGITVVVNHSVSAVDAASFQGHIRRHSNMIANEVTRALKRKGVR